MPDQINVEFGVDFLDKDILDQLKSSFGTDLMNIPIMVIQQATAQQLVRTMKELTEAIRQNTLCQKQS